MEYMGLNEVRERFLSFFEGKEHLRQPSFPLVPQGDNSLLLINSGMAPLKPYFSGEAVPPRKRMTTCQKCIRTPDIERVGKTARHGTFFEMLGNFSFGDYFKREASGWAWEFITEVMQIPTDRLYVSVYLDDDEAFDIWTKEIGVPESHMTRLGKADNFWEIGSGPCGPCSEIYYDRGEKHSCGSKDCFVGCDCDRYVEFWNLVFTQYNNDGQGNYTPLAQKNIDTGMGLERLAAIMQGVDNLFEVDTIKNIMLHISEIAGVKYKSDEKTDISLRVITDHIRSTTMLVCDGVLPSNEGRGYVLRRLLRRAARHGRLLGIERPFLNEVCETVIRESSSAYPALEEKRAYIKKVITMEEERFSLTIDTGGKMLLDMIAKLRQGGVETLSGEDAFRLYDTYGYPVDLTVEILEEEKLGIDMDEFEGLMKAQKERARAARASLGDLGWTSENLGLDRSVTTEFTGYGSFEEESKVLALVVNGKLADSVSDGQGVTLVLDKTPFYAESGGQVADTGTIGADTGLIRVEDVRKTPDGKYLHIGVCESGALSARDTVKASIDASRRKAIMRAHSATHLLQKALRNTLGDHVEQAGSLVEPDRIRFDFTHFSAVTPEEQLKIINEVNREIMEGLPITVREMPIADAKKLGAMALFGEKYGDTVRVVSMGDYSVELCGGTHLDNTAKASLFSITSEYSVAAGVRRIEAKVGLALYEDYFSQTKRLFEAASALKTSPLELAERIRGMLDETRQLRRELELVRQRDFLTKAEGFLLSAKLVEGIRVITASLPGSDPEALRKIGDFIRDKEPGVVAVLATESGGKVSFLAVCGKDAIARGISAGSVIKAVTKAAGGTGGGKPDTAMGGGRDPSLIDDALAIVDGFVAENAR